MTLTLLPAFVALLPQASIPHRVNAPLVAGGDVQAEVQASPDGRWVVYRADQDVDQTYELYSASTTTHALVKLSAPMIPGGSVRPADPRSFAISPDGARVVYRANGEVLGRNDLDSVPIDGSLPPVRLSGGRSVVDFAITADGTRVVMEAGLMSRRHLFASPLEGGQTPVQLSPPPSGASEIVDFALDPTGARVVYLFGSGTLGLYSALVDGSQPPVLLQAGLAQEPFEIAPGGARVVFRDGADLFSVPIGGGTPVQLEPPLLPGRAVASFQIAAGGARVVYLADQDVNDALQLYSVPIDGSGTAIGLSGPMVAGGDVDLYRWRVGPRGPWVAYQADQDVNDLQEVYAVRSDGGAGPVKLSPAGLPAPGVSFSGFAPDGRHVVFGSTSQTYCARIGGGQAVLLAGATPGGSLGWQCFDSAGRNLAFSADPDGDGIVDLYGVPLDGTRAPVLLDQPLAAGERVLDGSGALQYVERMGRFLYRARLGGDVQELFLSRRLEPRRP